MIPAQMNFRVISCSPLTFAQAVSGGLRKWGLMGSAPHRRSGTARTGHDAERRGGVELSPQQTSPRVLRATRELHDRQPRVPLEATVKRVVLGCIQKGALISTVERHTAVVTPAIISEQLRS